MPGFSDYAENKIVDLVMRGQAFTAPTNTYLGLLTCTKGIVARSTAYALNDTAVVSATDSKYHFYKVTTAGTTAGSAPTYAGVAGEAITDGTAVLTEQDAALDANTAIVEPSGGSYARTLISGALASWAGTQSAGSTTASSGTGGVTSNNGSVALGPSSAAWAAAPAMVWGVGLFDASTTGNLLWWGPMSTPQNFGTATTITFAAGQVTFTVG